MNAVTVLPSASNGRALTAVDVREHVNLIQEVMRAVMKPDVHYGVIPGCDKPSLYKAGSEVLLSTFRIAVSVLTEDLSTADCIRYRIRTVGTHQQSGVVVGEGIGECSTDEAKYKWRRCYDKREFAATPESRKRIRYVTAKGKEYENMEVRTEPADLANTVLKMAKKRAQIDLTLTSTAASDIFTQDIEDIPEELRTEVREDSGKPTDGVWRGIEPEQRGKIERIAASIADFIADNDPAAAFRHIVAKNLSAEHKSALWTLLPSQTRTALTKEHAAEPKHAVVETVTEEEAAAISEARAHQ